jgi:uncharacterized cupredoxin-like copper-binding protein
LCQGIHRFSFYTNKGGEFVNFPSLECNQTGANVEGIIWKPTIVKFGENIYTVFVQNVKKRRYHVKKLLFILMFVMVFVLSACGGKASTTINVSFAEFTFSPSEFTIPASQEITLNATNNGAVVHEFVIMKFGQTVGNDFGDEDEGNIYWEVEAAPGSTVKGTFIAPTEPGDYQIVCGTPGHFMAGMVGKLTVVSP